MVLFYESHKIIRRYLNDSLDNMYVHRDFKTYKAYNKENVYICI